jgi:NAD(P)-dependent dehydrogenase (short-subunit alcohol dehydrogenase family)
MGSLSGTAKTNFFVTQGNLKGYSSGTKPVLAGRRSISAALTGYLRGTRGAQVNFFGTVRLCQALLPLLRASRGRVVNIGSIGARMPSAFGSAYADGTQHATSTRQMGCNIDAARSTRHTARNVHVADRMQHRCGKIHAAHSMQRPRATHHAPSTCHSPRNGRAVLTTQRPRRYLPTKAAMISYSESLRQVARSPLAGNV